ncbi:beta-N-acetylhexosaminidase [Cerasicoccus frondis]|uniref:beta-N-acetylhexosaminidase n=1 Tax=Cerasicoccus frondis TaxID=490090 RepID=UPI002852C2B3|nr:family 20 glycosylhydrolase [Cerasicoccus frondis]
MLPTELADGIEAIKGLFPDSFNEGDNCWKIEFKRQSSDKPLLIISHDSGQSISITYSEPACAFRAMGILMGQMAGNLTPQRIYEQSTFLKIGAMVDASRNGVPRMDTLKKLICHFALMGINQLMLYTEDTYEIPGEPTFGYFRGGYTQTELREIDNFAVQFGLEVIPCIQTLGHLEQVLQWPEYQGIKDTNGVLLVGEEGTDRFVEKMIQSASAPFRSNRIHIGMDEAHGVGSGIYRLKNGLRPPFDILCEHMQKTVETCRRLNLKPMVWSDMFFRLSSPQNSYYDINSTIDPTLADKIPEDVQLVYWDYYHADKDFYNEWINRHRSLGKRPIFAAGIWTWNRFWAQLPQSMNTIRAGIQAAREEGLDETFVTMWGDDGMECELSSALPAVQCFADHAYSGEYTMERHTLNFLGSVGGTMEQWIAGSQLDILPIQSSSDFEANASKWIFWLDPLLGHFECQLLPEFVEHFRQVSAALTSSTESQPQDQCTEIIRHAAIVLTLKTELHLTLRSAYRARDLDKLESLNDSLINRLQQELIVMKDLHEVRWHTNFRCFGWEVIERRYAGLLSRITTLQKKLCDFLDAPHTTIPELECTPTQLWPHEQTQSITITHRQAATPSFIG